MMPLMVEYSIFFVSLTLALGLFLFWVLSGPIKRSLMKHHTVRMYYRHVNRVVLDNDFYLINCFENKTADEEAFHIDHIVIGQKYIYCIRDRYFDGALVVREDNDGWLFYHGRKKKIVPNPMAMNLLRLERLSLMSNIDSKLFISIVLINNDCLITPFEGTRDNSFLVSLKGFPKLIEYLESRDVEDLDPHISAIVARDFSELNLHGK